jgi:YbbR domain-containing protein
MRNRIQLWFVRDWPLKLVSLVLALALWLLLVPAEKMFSEKALTIPLETRNVPAGLEIVEPPVAAIDITLRAPNRLLDEIGPSGLVARIDLDRATVLQQEYPLNTSMIAVPPGAEVVKISPSKVAIRLERTAEAKLELRPLVRGRAAAGYRHVRTDIDPPSVVVRGPESLVGDVKAATTAPVDITGLTASTVFEADIILPRPELRLVSSQPRARVRVVVETDEAAAKAAPAKKKK